MPFTWENLNSDGGFWQHAETIEGFFKDVVTSSIEALNNQIDAYEKMDDPVKAFYISDAEDVLQITKVAFCLSIQSIWERQIRAYMTNIAKELKRENDIINATMNAPWLKLDDIFFKLRGIHLHDFPGYAELSKLHILANVCRHGNGPSAQLLWEAAPDYWPYYHRPSGEALQTEHPPTDNIDIPIEHLKAFVSAIKAFWSEAEYIYDESIKNKHPSLIRKLEIMRVERAKLTDV